MNGSSSGSLFFVGANHHTTPIELREKLALSAGKLAELTPKLRELEGLREFAVLNTCNRVEFYAFAESAEAAARLEALFCDFQGFSPEEFASIRQLASDQDAIRHLIEVSSGLNSQMLGETEILGQVKAAYALAQNERTVGPVLNRVFQKTFQYAKYVRSNTAITEGQISVANVAVDLAQKIFGPLDGARILLVGAGEIGEKTAKAFHSRGASAPTVTSRTLAHAMELATEFGGAALPFEHFPQHLSDFDVVVCSTSAPHAVITVPHVEIAMKRRKDQPLFLIDLALPRDVEADVASLQNVFVYNLDDLAKIAEKNRHARENEVARAREIATEKASALWSVITGTTR